MENKVLVLTGCDENMLRVGGLTEANQRSYAKRHGYHFEAIHEYHDKTHPSWQKVENILSRMDSYDLILWLDADTLVTNPLIRIQDIIGEKEGVILSRDWGDENSPSYFSAGNMVITSCEPSRRLLEEIQTRNKWENKDLWEQSALREIYDEGGELNDYVHIMPRRVLNSVPVDAQNQAVEPWEFGDFLCHMTGVPNKRRLEMIRKYEKSGIGVMVGEPCLDYETVMMMDVRHIALIMEIIKRARWESALEIGTWKGASTKALLSGLDCGSLGKLTCCDVDFKPEFLKTIEGYDVKLENRDGVEVLKECDDFDVIMVDGNHELGQGIKETREIIRRSPDLVIHHDVTAEVAGFDGCGGPAYAHSALQADGWYCLIDCRKRGGEKTERGIMLSTKKKEILDLIVECMGLVCY